MEPLVIALASNERYFPGLYCALASALSHLDATREADVRVLDGGRFVPALVAPNPPRVIESLVTIFSGSHFLTEILLRNPQNIDRLHWLMSRFQGYVGLISFMGARFTASEQGLSPVLRDIAKRGLIYVDDGSSSRSIASQLAGTQNLPFAKADVVLDTVPTTAEIDHALARLEMKARDSGIAVGYATAKPGTVARIADWIKKAESKGIILVPITMVAIKAKSS